MSSGIDLQFIRDYYQGITDQQLIHILAENSEGLTADAIQIIKEEVIRRGLKPEMLAGVEASSQPSLARPTRRLINAYPLFK